jgi:hypothetical protein
MNEKKSILRKDSEHTGIYDVEDVKFEIEAATYGEVIEKDGRVVFRLDSRVVKLDVTDCDEIPSKFTFRKHVKSGCDPDKCIAEKRKSCGECKFELFANEVGFNAELLFAQKNDEKRFIATYKIY